ncbi:hypothetical protein [Acrocarpospora catenulata]|uniref:hypothetical protein n=1 Tax=Acrocarpospora catenulata TaxID=2836182 RepID=UPI001BDAC54F|nr:hypothetical protein [Acrocarpospora catenulata]
MGRADDEYFARRTAESIGKNVKTFPFNGPVFKGRIVDGDFSTGQWVVEAADGTRRTIPGPDMQEDASS